MSASVVTALVYITQVWLSACGLRVYKPARSVLAVFFLDVRQPPTLPNRRQHTFCLQFVDHKCCNPFYLLLSLLRSRVVICCASLCHELARWYNRCVQQSTGPISEASPDSPNYDIKIYKGIHFSQIIHLPMQTPFPPLPLLFRHRHNPLYRSCTDVGHASHTGPRYRRRRYKTTIAG